MTGIRSGGALGGCRQSRVLPLAATLVGGRRVAPAAGVARPWGGRALQRSCGARSSFAGPTVANAHRLFRGEGPSCRIPDAGSSRSPCGKTGQGPLGRRPVSSRWPMPVPKRRSFSPQGRRCGPLAATVSSNYAARPRAFRWQPLLCPTVSLIGLPPSGGFMAKWMLIQASLASGQWWWALVIVGAVCWRQATSFVSFRRLCLCSGTTSQAPVPGLMEW